MISTMHVCINCLGKQAKNYFDYPSKWDICEVCGEHGKCKTVHVNWLSLCQESSQLPDRGNNNLTWTTHKK